VTDYRVCIHEAGHAVASSVLGIPYACVSVSPRDGHLGRLSPSPASLEMLLSDPIDGDWAAASFAIVCIAGPAAEAAYMNERLDWPASIDWSEYGGAKDIASAHDIADGIDVKFESLLADAARMWSEDRVWLAVQRVADRLAEETLLTFGAVDRLIGRERSVA